jgi:DNA-binding protein HU-beta
MSSRSTRMTQSEVFNYIAERTSLNRAQVKQFFEDLASLAASEVKSGGEFVLPGFGKLVRSERKAREGRNPATGETIQIPAKTTLKFRVRKAVKAAGLGGEPISAADELGGDVIVDPD